MTKIQPPKPDRGAMKIIEDGFTIKQGPDSEYEQSAEISFEINNNATIIICVNGEESFRMNCLDMKNIINAFDI